MQNTPNAVRGSHGFKTIVARSNVVFFSPIIHSEFAITKWNVVLGEERSIRGELGEMVT